MQSFSVSLSLRDSTCTSSVQVRQDCSTFPVSFLAFLTPMIARLYSEVKLQQCHKSCHIFVKKTGFEKMRVIIFGRKEIVTVSHCVSTCCEFGWRWVLNHVEIICEALVHSIISRNIRVHRQAATYSPIQFFFIKSMFFFFRKRETLGIYNSRISRACKISLFEKLFFFRDRFFVSKNFEK